MDGENPLEPDSPARAGGRCAPWAWLLVLSTLVACSSRCARSPQEEGTGGSGEADEVLLGQEAVPPSEDESTRLDVLAVTIGDPTSKVPRTSFVTLESIAARGRVQNVTGLDERIQWALQPAGPQAGVADAPSRRGPEAVFHLVSRVGTEGSRRPNPPLEYELVASLPAGLVEGQVRLPPAVLLRQDEEDVLRQEYIDYGTGFQPSRKQISLPALRALNTGNYSVIAEKEAGGLLRLLQQVEQKVNALLNNDVQARAVGTRGLTPRTVVVSPGAAVLAVGALGDTDPEGDDVCQGPPVAGRCAGAILAGPDGVANTRANNRQTRLALEDLVSSAYRNPQRNRAVGSASPDSRHTLGDALDIDPRLTSIPGKTLPQVMCLVEAAGDAVVGARNSFAERGSTTFVGCDSPSADHIHVQR